ncbi:MAG: class I SAM-dependent methyltransferase, partial [Cyanobacteria bacterium REEB65]|nr:class I SAM-dependent methyltransferase [Cyanobacteria bacterium REEB65]
MKPSIQHVSDTAAWVAFCRAEESARPDALISDPLARRLVGDRGPQLAEEMSALLPVMERWMGVRTAVLDDMILRALEDL